VHLAPCTRGVVGPRPASRATSAPPHLRLAGEGPDFLGLISEVEQPAVGCVGSHVTNVFQQFLCLQELLGRRSSSTCGIAGSGLGDDLGAR
jgi:hypothetical protein